MIASESSEPYREGAYVRILNSGYGLARIAEYRGPLGPQGARVYRVLVREKPRPVHIEALESQLQLLPDPESHEIGKKV